MNLLVAVVLAALGGGAVTALIQAIAGRLPRRADVTQRLVDAAMKQVDQLQERTADAERRWRNVEAEAEATGARLREVRAECDALVARIATLARWIHDPAMTLGELRRRVPAPGTDLL